ncbi:MAG: preprotein translocase subunit YajC [Gemmatimonadaceae bacterium]
MTASLLPAHFLLQAAGVGSSPLLPFLFQIAAIFGIFYFLMIRPQQKQRREHEARLKALKRGDMVVTAGGVVGEVMHIKESAKDADKASVLEDHITVKSGESRLVVERGKIARVVSPATTAVADA